MNLVSGSFTFGMIKPDAVEKSHIGEILMTLENAGFRIKALRMHHLSMEEAGQFYRVHEGKPFYDRLVEFMSSGPIVAMVLEKENAVLDYRKAIGSTDPSLAEEGTIRKKFAQSKEENAVHGADSNENAAIEALFFFKDINIK